MHNNISIDPLSDLEKKSKDFISIEDDINSISKKFNCSFGIAAEIILSKLPDEYDFDDNIINPKFFVKRLGIATFSYCNDYLSIRTMLLSIIEGDQYVFKSAVDLDDKKIPF